MDEFYFNDDKIDMYLFSTAGENQSLDRLQDLPIYTPQGSVLPLGALATITEKVDTAQIRRVDGRRTVTLYIIPPRSIALETAVVKVRQDIIRPMREDGQLPDGGGEWLVARVCSEYLQYCERGVANGSISQSHHGNSAGWLNDLCEYCGALPVAHDTGGIHDTIRRRPAKLYCAVPVAESCIVHNYTAVQSRHAVDTAPHFPLIGVGSDIDLNVAHRIKRLS